MLPLFSLPEFQCPIDPQLAEPSPSRCYTALPVLHAHEYICVLPCSVQRHRHRQYVLLMGCLAAIEKTRLTEMITKRFTALTDLVTINTFLIAFKTTILCCWRSFSRPVIINRVWFITGLTGMYNTLM